MKRKDLLKELNGLSIDDLKGRAQANAEERMKLRFRHASGQLEQSHRLGQLKKEYARIQTVIRVKRTAAA